VQQVFGEISPEKEGRNNTGGLGTHDLPPDFRMLRTKAFVAKT
jgi:hypothetical protein